MSLAIMVWSRSKVNASTPSKPLFLADFGGMSMHFNLHGALPTPPGQILAVTSRSVADSTSASHDLARSLRTSNMGRVAYFCTSSSRPSR